MMSMIEDQKSDNGLYGKEYTWKKEWVRPYESMYSIFLRFCKVNMMKGTQALKQFKLNKNGYGTYIPSFLMYDAIGHKNNIHLVYEELVPYWYYEQIDPFISMDERTASRCFHTWKIAYCPRCIQEEAYHSILHQVKEMRYCPFHKEQQLVVCDKPSYYYRITSILCSNESSFSINNAYFYKLPCFTDNNPARYLTNKMSSLCKYDMIYLESSRTEPQASETHFYDLIYGKKPSKVLTAEQVSANINYLNDIFCKWFNELDMPREWLYGNRSYKIPSFSYVDDYIRLFMFYKYHRLIEADINILRERSRTISRIPGGRIDISDIPRLKYFFINMMHDGPYMGGALNLQWILRPGSYANERQNNTGEGHSPRDLFNDNCIFGSYLETATIQCLILSDFIDEMWKQFLELAKRPEGISAEDGWKELVPPVYYVCHVSHLDYYEILRY